MAGKSKAPVEFSDREKIVRVDPFGYRLHIVVTNDIRASFEKRRRKVRTRVEISPKAMAFTVTNRNTMDVYVFYPENAGVGTTVHEIVHVVTFVMKQAGAEFEEEVWAYHIDHLTQVASEFIWKPYTFEVKKRENGTHKEARRISSGSTKSKELVRTIGKSRNKITIPGFQRSRN